MQLLVAESLCVARVNDFGCGFPWEERLQASLDLETDTERGRGLAMVKLFVDYVSFNELSNEVIIIVRTGSE